MKITIEENEKEMIRIARGHLKGLEKAAKKYMHCETGFVQTALQEYKKGLDVLEKLPPGTTIY